MNLLPFTARYFSVRSAVVLGVIGVSAAIVSAIGQHCVTHLTIVSVTLERHSSELQQRIASLRNVPAQTRAAAEEHDQLSRLTESPPVSRTLAAWINWLPADALVDQFSAASSPQNEIAVAATMHTRQTLAQFRAKPVPTCFLSAHVDQTENAAMQFEGVVGNGIAGSQSKLR